MEKTARQEWSNAWPVPLIGMLGVSGSTIFPYVYGLLIGPMTQAFGWSRSQYSFALMLQVLVGLIVVPFAGKLIDRYGPRTILLRGIPVAVLGALLLPLVGQPIWQWWLFAVIQGITMALVLPVGWIATVIRQFETSRGIALAFTLAGVGLGAAIWPVAGAFLLESLGWRWTFTALACAWAAVLFPLAFVGIPNDRRFARAPATGKVHQGRLAPTLRSPTFLLLTIAGSLFLITIYGLNLHLIPMLKARGYTTEHAAGIASLAGIAAIFGRLLTGLLLDHLPTKPLGTAIFLLPLVAIFLLWSSMDMGWSPVLAVIILGLSLGAETDIIAYVASCEFDAAIFASAYAVVCAVFGLCAGIGPFLVSVLYDASQSYDGFLMVACGLIVLGAGLIWLLPLGPAHSRVLAGSRIP